MEVNQVYSVLNDINKQMWGEDALGVHDLSGIISMGQTVLDSSNTDMLDKSLRTFGQFRLAGGK